MRLLYSCLALIGSVLLPLPYSVVSAQTDSNSVLEVYDARGKVLRFDAPARTVISLAPHLTEIVFALGAGDQLLGVSTHCDYPAQAKDLPEVADYQSVNYELITLKQADVILAWGSGNNLRRIERLEALGHKVYVSNPQTLADIIHDTRAIGRITGHTQQAEQQIEQFNDALPPTLDTTEPAAVLYLVSASPAVTLSRASWVSQIIDYCGGENIYRKTIPVAPVLSREALLQTQVDLLVHSMQDVQASSLKRLVGSDVAVLYIEPDLIQRPSLRIVAGVRSLCERIETLNAKNRSSRRH